MENKKVYIEFKNGVVVPTGFPDSVTATKALNASGSFITINGNVYNKFEIKRTFILSENLFLKRISEQPYETQTALRAIIKKRESEGKKTRTFEQLMKIYEKEKKGEGGLNKYGLPFFVSNSNVRALGHKKAVTNEKKK